MALNTMDVFVLGVSFDSGRSCKEGAGRVGVKGEDT